MLTNARSSPHFDRRLTPDEERFHREWRGYVSIVESVAGAIEAIGSLEMRHTVMIAKVQRVDKQQ